MFSLLERFPDAQRKSWLSELRTAFCARILLQNRFAYLHKIFEVTKLGRILKRIALSTVLTDPQPLDGDAVRDPVSLNDELPCRLMAA
jgi:hypothetical protein